jgi:Predicted ATPase
VDLAHCQRQWAASKTIAPFEPGCADPVSPSCERLYGRKAEQKVIALMLKALRRDSKPQVLFINGAAGMGKSSLVEATLKAHAEGYWAIGKCNSPEQAVPYAPSVGESSVHWPPSCWPRTAWTSTPCAGRSCVESKATAGCSASWPRTCN